MLEISNDDLCEIARSSSVRRPIHLRPSWLSLAQRKVASRLNPGGFFLPALRQTVFMVFAVSAKLLSFTHFMNGKRIGSFAYTLRLGRFAYLLKKTLRGFFLSAVEPITAYVRSLSFTLDAHHNPSIAPSESLQFPQIVVHVRSLISV